MAENEPVSVYVWVIVIEPNCPIPFSTNFVYPSPKSNSAPVISLSVSFPAQENKTVNGAVPNAGIVESPLHVGATLEMPVGVGEAVGVGVCVMVAVGVAAY